MTGTAVFFCLIVAFWFVYRLGYQMGWSDMAKYALKKFDEIEKP